MNDIASGSTKKSPTIASAGATSSMPAARFAGRAVASGGVDATAVNRAPVSSLFQHHSLVTLDDVGEVFGHRKRPAVGRKVGGRDVGEELVPVRRRKLGLHVFRVDAWIPVELLDDAVGLH